MTVTHEDLRAGRLNVYRLTGREADDLVAEYDAVLAERNIFAAENQAMHEHRAGETEPWPNHSETPNSSQDEDTATPAGWTIVSIGNDGSVLCQSPSGCRRRYWFQVADVDRLHAENEKLKAFISDRVADRSAMMKGGYHARRICLEAETLLGRRE